MPCCFYFWGFTIFWYPFFDYELNLTHVCFVWKWYISIIFSWFCEFLLMGITLNCISSFFLSVFNKIWLWSIKPIKYQYQYKKKNISLYFFFEKCKGSDFSFSQFSSKFIKKKFLVKVLLFWLIMNMMSFCFMQIKISIL